jgi:type II secretory ATPase GspE/PulE/Tfp pilus assembly ATPase PilB-like protein
VATQPEIDALLDEFAQELAHTAAWKADPQGSRAALAKEWRTSFGNDKGEIVLHEAVGCEVCGGTGYKGRVGLHELLLGSDAVKKHIQEHARVAEIVATALEDGMRTLKQDGIEKVLQGITDIKQVRAVCIK